MRRLLSRAVIAAALVAGMGMATAGAAAAAPAPTSASNGTTATSVKGSAPASPGGTYRTQDWWL